MNYLLYLFLLLFGFLFYFVLTLSGFVPLVAQLYGLVLLKVIHHLSNVDIYLLNAIHCLMLTGSLSNKNFKGMSYRGITPLLQFLISTFILYISFRALTTLMFYVINNVILRRNICESIHISFRASNPITNVYMGIFVATGASIYFSDLLARFRQYFGPLTPLVHIFIKSIDDLTNWFMELSANLIPFIGPAVKQYMEALYKFIELFESISSKYGGDCDAQSKHLLEMFKGINSEQDVKTQLDLTAEKDQALVSRIFTIITNLRLYLSKKKTENRAPYASNSSVPFTGRITSRILCALFKCLEYYKKYNESIGGKDKMYNLILRGFNSAIIALTIPLLITLLMVVFWPCNFYGNEVCPRSLKW